jgi:hypothetical protein
MCVQGKYFMPQLDTDVLLEAWPQLAILLADAELDTGARAAVHADVHAAVRWRAGGPAVLAAVQS